MKILKSKILISLTLLISLISCKAQTFPLNTSLSDIPNNAYVKDNNNELNPYVGIYKANFNGFETTLYITKVESKLEKRSQKQFYRDALVIKYIVKNSTGVILQDTQNNNLNIADLHSVDVDTVENKVIFIYGGTNCRIGWGDVYLKKINLTQISWEYRPDDRVIMPGQCEGNLDKTIYLPETKNLIFTKQ